MAVSVHLLARGLLHATVPLAALPIDGSIGESNLSRAREQCLVGSVTAIMSRILALDGSAKQHYRQSLRQTPPKPIAFATTYRHVGACIDYSNQIGY